MLLSISNILPSVSSNYTSRFSFVSICQSLANWSLLLQFQPVFYRWFKWYFWSMAQYLGYFEPILLRRKSILTLQMRIIYLVSMFPVPNAAKGWEMHTCVRLALLDPVTFWQNMPFCRWWATDTCSVNHEEPRQLHDKRNSISQFLFRYGYHSKCLCCPLQLVCLLAWFTWQCLQVMPQSWWSIAGSSPNIPS